MATIVVRRAAACAVALCAAAAAQPQVRPAVSPHVASRVLTIFDGTVTIEFDAGALADLNWRVATKGGLDEAGNGLGGSFPIQQPSVLEIGTAVGTPPHISGADVRTRGGFLLDWAGVVIPLAHFTIEARSDGTWQLISALGDQSTDGQFALELVSMEIEPDGDDYAVRLDGDLTITPDWAHHQGFPDAAGTIVATLLLDALAGRDDTSADAGMGVSRVDGADSIAGTAATSDAGPDLVPSNIQSAKRWTHDPDEGITAYSIGTAACNVGDAGVGWDDNSNRHPVIAQNMYRLKEGMFEQIGMSWLTHAIILSSSATCEGSDVCQPNHQVKELGPGCLDILPASLNGFQGNLGPRWEVNAATGDFSWPLNPGSLPPIVSDIDRRLQVHDSDLSPALNAGAQYFLEAHYVTPDDPVAGNEDNNASYRHVTVTELSPDPPWYVIVIDFTDSTHDGEPAILAWEAQDPAVQLTYEDVPGDGRFILGCSVTRLSNGLWHYEYAVQNLNSDRSGQSFQVSIPDGVEISNIEFHDVDTHSGSPYSTTDWTATLEAGELAWATASFDTNQNANALRWGSLYNFRFDADTCPVQGSATLGLFKPGEPSEAVFATKVPAGPIVLTDSIPPDGAVDARQPSRPDGSAPDGWREIDLVFSNCAADLNDLDFSVSQLGGEQAAPVVDGVDHPGDSTVRVRLSRTIEDRAWTTITPRWGGSVRLGYLPGNVNGDTTSSPAIDLSALIDCLNNPGSCEDWQSNINRDSSVSVVDLTRLIDLFNGAGVYDSYTGATLP